MASAGSEQVPEEAIWRFATALAGARTAEDVSEAVAELAADAAAAAFSNMAVVDEATGQVHVAHGSTLPSRIAARWARLDLQEPTPLGDAIVNGGAVLLPSVEVIAERYPALVADTVASSLQATASIPVRSARGEVIGAVGFGWGSRQRFDDIQVHRLELIAHLVGQALVRAVGSNTTRRASGDETARLRAEQAFLPWMLPASAHLQLGAAYLPASDAPLGGDWYDAFDVDDRLCMVIGDVAGHGDRAAAVMAQLRNVARGFADEDPQPGRVLQRLNRLLWRFEPDDTATAIAAVYDPRSPSALVLAAAGHVPALIAVPGEPVRMAPTVSGLMLGVEPASHYDDHRVDIPVGATVVLYTDGLVETRRRGLDEGISDLAQFLQALPPLPARDTCDHVVDWRLAAGRREDDMCVLVARLAP